MPVEKSEFLFSVYVVEPGNWHRSMGKMKTILRQSLKPVDQARTGLSCLGRSPSQTSRKLSFDERQVTWGHQCQETYLKNLESFSYGVNNSLPHRAFQGQGVLGIELTHRILSYVALNNFIWSYLTSFASIDRKFPKALGVKRGRPRLERGPP